MICGESFTPERPTERKPALLVIGYGNTLRRDDGVGPRVAEAVAAHAVARNTDAGFEATALPGPTRLTYPVASIEIGSGRGSAATITRLLADAGFRALDATDPSSPANDALLRGRLDYLAPEGTARIQVRWRWVDRSGRLYHAVRRRIDPGPGSDLGILLGTPRGLVGPLLAAAGIGRGGRIVDLGCGDGRVLIEAARTLAHVGPVEADV